MFVQYAASVDEFGPTSESGGLHPPRSNGPRGLAVGAVLVLYPRDTVSEMVLERISRILAALGRVVTAVGDRKPSEERGGWNCPFPTKPGILHHAIFQIRLATLLFRNRDSYREVWLLTGGTAMPIPLAMARLTGKVVFLLLTGSASKIEEAKVGAKSFSSALLTLSERITTAFASRVVAYGKSAIVDMGLEGWREDFFTTGAEFVDINQFPYRGPISSRNMDIGFVGRLSPEKGLTGLIESIGTLHQDYPELHLSVAGVGPESEKLLELSRRCGVADQVHFVGWIDHVRLSEFYGSLRLLIIPSSTEGLPNAMLEAMASGTIVLATRVGAIPDVICPETNGFLVDENSARSLEGAIRGIFRNDSATLDQIARNARLTIMESYSFDAAVERYRPLVQEGPEA